jgi:DNA-binding response OmpR family regulator
MNLPPSSGLDVLKKLRQHSQVPVIMLTAWEWDEAKVSAFEAGADDYVTKPLSHRELIARIGVQLRRSGWQWSPHTFPRRRVDSNLG